MYVVLCFRYNVKHTDSGSDIGYLAIFIFANADMLLDVEAPSLLHLCILPHYLSRLVSDL